ncbi:MAG: hypothetical protein N4A74_19040 [Carboxylicivirga sp.]|jgi:hypothetical protein|nr:hypothetical protein [Carboxylicivirga sp.]
MKSYITILISVLFVSYSNAQNNNTALSIENLNVSFNEGRMQPNGVKDGNSLSISFKINNSQQANRFKVIIKDKNTQEILEIKTIKITVRDNVTFYNLLGTERRLKRDILNFNANVNELLLSDVQVEVFGISKQNTVTKKLIYVGE